MGHGGWRDRDGDWNGDAEDRVLHDTVVYHCHTQNRDISENLVGGGFLAAVTGGTGWIYTLLRGDDDGEPSSTIHVGVDPRRVQVTFRKGW